MSGFEALRWINLEPIAACNLRCPHCSRDGSARPQGAMELDLFARLLAQVPEGCEVRLFLSGEPFLDARLAERVRLCAAAGRRSLVHTNGTHCTTERVRAVLAAGLSQVSVSIDGGSLDEYARMRPGSGTRPAWGGLAEILHWRDRLRAPTRVILQSIRPHPAPLDVMAELGELAERCDEVYVRHPHNWAQMASVDGSAPASYGEVCSFLRVSQSVQADGLVVPCCAVLNGERIIGDAKVESLRAIWERESVAIARAQERGEYVPVCSTCERYGRAAEGVAV